MKASAKPPPNPIEGEKREYSTKKEDKSVLLASPLNPSYDIAGNSKGVRGIQQSSLGAFQDVSLINEVVENFSALGDEIIQLRLCAIDEGMFM